MVPLEQGEYVIREVRRHWFFVAIQILFSTFCALLPVVCFIGVSFIPNNLDASAVLKAYIVVLSPLWWLFIWVYFFYFWTEYYLSALVVTNKRILDIDQKALFYREISTFPLENIQDITIDINGVIATLLHFGDIDVQTAGENKGFRIDNAANPEQVKQIISDAHDQALEKLRATSVL